MRSEWREQALSELADINPKRYIKKADSAPFIEMAALPTDARDIPICKIESRKFTGGGSKFKDGDTLLARITPCLENGKTALISGLGEGNHGHGSTEFIVLCPKSVSDTKFIYYLVRSDSFREHVIARMEGTSGRQRVPTTAVKEYRFFCPPIDQRNEIGEILGTLDDRIKLFRETNTTLESIAQALFKSWFVDFDPVHAKQEGRVPEGMNAETASLFPDSFEESIPKGWELTRLGQITELITKGTTPTTLKRPFVKSGINFLKVESLTADGQFLPEKFAYIDKETNEQLRRSQLKADDVLITIAGTIGRIAVMIKDFLPANINQAIAIIRPKSEVLPAGLIKRFLQRRETQQNMKEKVVQAVQANLSLGSLSDLKVVLPSSDVTSRLYETGFMQFDACITLNEQVIRTLTSIRDILLPHLISGNLPIFEHD